MGFILLGLVAAFALVVVVLKRPRWYLSAATPRIVLDKRKLRAIAPYAFYLSGLRRNQLWARATLHSAERAAQADKLADECRRILLSLGFRKELSYPADVSPRRFNEMMGFLADDPAFVGVCARSLGLLMAGLPFLKELQEDLPLAAPEQLDTLVTDLMNTTIESLGESSPQD